MHRTTNQAKIPATTCPFKVSMRSSRKFTATATKSVSKTAPTVFSQLLLTSFLFAVLVAFLYGVVPPVMTKVQLVTEKSHQIQDCMLDLPETIREFVSWTRSLRVTIWPPAEWYSEKTDWNGVIEIEFYLLCAAITGFALDIFLSSEASQGSPYLLVPSVLFSFVYFTISTNASASGLYDPEVIHTMDATRIGREVYGLPQIVAGVFSHILAFNTGLAYGMLLDFYSRITSRSMIWRLVMLIVVVTPTSVVGFLTLPVYFILRATIFAGPKIVKQKGCRGKGLLDPIPYGGGALTSWVRKIPAPFNRPVAVACVGVGVVRFFLMLGIYLTYVFFVCLPLSAVFFSLRRAMMISSSHKVHGATFSVFETVDKKMFPFKAVLVVSAHLRLICFKNRNNVLFNFVFGWWIRPLLSAFVMYEFTVPFKRSFAPYCAFLMEEFGPVFPMGEGLGFGSHADVKYLMENPNLRKSGLSLAWSISKSQLNWSKNNLTTHPRRESEKSVVDEGRKIIGSWLHGVTDKLKDERVKQRLDAILPLANADGNPVEKELVEIAFGSTLFHLLTDGELSATERKHYHKLLTNAFPFLSDFINNIWFGGIFEYLGIQDYDMMRRAILRYSEADALQRTLALASESKWDSWTPPEIVRFLAYKFSIAGGAAPAFLLSAIIQKLFDDTDLAAEYRAAMEQGNKKRKRKIILEIARLERCVPLVNFTAYNFTNAHGDFFVTIFDQEIPVPNGTPLHCSIQNANRDANVFGEDAEMVNIERPDEVLGGMMSFNGNQNDIAEGSDKPVRHCPGYDTSLDIIEFLVDRYMPPVEPPIDIGMESRLKEIKAQESFVMKFILKVGKKTYTENNKYFPHASEIVHPFDTAGTALGSGTIVTAGERTIACYDEDVTMKERQKDNLTSLFLKFAPLTDDDGEWESPEEAIKWRISWFSSNFPPANYDYVSNFSSFSALMSELAFSGFCCLHTKKVDSYPKDGIIYKNANGATYVNENIVLSRYAVRRGYQRYGAAAYFDRDCNITGVYTCCDGMYHTNPSTMNEDLKAGGGEVEETDPAWRHAMWAWRVSAMALVTVDDHLVNVHMVNANTLASASRLHLSVNHPLRAFLKFFTFKTIGINSKAHKTLLGRKGIVNRNWAFETEALQSLISNTKVSFKKKFTDYVPESMRKEEQNYPVNQDLEDFYRIVKELVTNFFLITYDAAESGVQDKVAGLQTNLDEDLELQAFLVGLSEGLGLDRLVELQSFEEITETLTSLICSGTGMHELVGHLADTFSHPLICGTTIRRNKEIDSIQMYQLNCTLVSSTGLRMPRLLENWEHLLNRHRFADATVLVMRKFRADLEDLSIEIDRRNESRRFKLEAFNPNKMESSVSV